MQVKRKSSPLIAIGAAVFVLGTALGLLVIRSGGSSTTVVKPSASPATTTTLATGAVVVPGAATPSTGYAFTIPAGKNAVAVNAGFVPGLAGFVRAGDDVNIFANVSKAKVGSANPPLTKLVATDVQVLAVLTPPPTLGGSATVTYLLALDPVSAEQVIFFETNEALYFTLAPKGAAPAATPGRDYQNAA